MNHIYDFRHTLQLSLSCAQLAAEGLVEQGFFQFVQGGELLPANRSKCMTLGLQRSNGFSNFDLSRHRIGKRDQQGSDVVIVDLWNR